MNKNLEKLVTAARAFLVSEARLKEVEKGEAGADVLFGIFVEMCRKRLEADGERFEDALNALIDARVAGSVKAILGPPA